MTVSTAPTALSYNGDDSTVNFAITWKYFSKGDVVVIHRDTSDVETTWVLDTDYTLTPAGVDSGGTLTATTAPATGEKITITLEPANTQSSSMPLGGSFPSETVEDALDLAAQRDAKITEVLNRVITVPKTDTQTGSLLELDIDADRANKYFIFDANGKPSTSTGSGTDTALRTDLAASGGSNLVGFLQSGTGAVAETAQTTLRRTIFASQFGVTGDGVTDDTTNLGKAITAAAGRTLVITGTPLITSTITISSHIDIIFDGAPGNYSGRYPDSYLIKDSTMTTTALIISGESVSLVNGGVVGEAGNTGDNIQITGHSIRWDNLFSTLAGQDGLRIGEAASGTPNTNAFILNKPCCVLNGRYGIHLSDDDAGGAPNANAGTLISPFVQNNTSHGLYINNAFGNTIIGILSQSNTGKGVYLDERSVSNFFIGGDIETNSGGAGTAGSDVVTVTSVLAAGGQYGGNGFLGTNIGTPPTDNATLTSRGWQGFDGFGTASGTGSINSEGTWTPTIAGDSTAGTNTYSIQTGIWFKNGRMVTALFDVALSGNSVAMVGNLRISGLPFAVLSGSLGSYSPSLISALTYPASVTAITGAMNGTNIDLKGYGDNITFQAIPVANIGASTGRLSGTITYVTPAVL